MKAKADILNKGSKIVCFVVASFLALNSISVNGQVKYSPANDLCEAGMGVERVARYYLPAYASMAANNNEIRWVQIDLGQVKKIDGIKLLPGVQGWGPAAGGFPARFLSGAGNAATCSAGNTGNCTSNKNLLLACRETKRYSSGTTIFPGKLLDGTDGKPGY